MKDYHCCATCRHFEISRTNQGPRARCARLGYDTKSNYKFNCWNPRPDIQERMRKASANQPPIFPTPSS